MIQEKEYKKRKDKLANKLSPHSVGVLLSAEYKTRSNDTEYPYRQNSNFYYMSGFKEDNAALVFVKTKKSFKTVLFVQKKDETIELWSGKRLGEIEAKKRFSVDEVYTSDMFEEKLKEFIKDKNNLYFDLDSTDKRVRNIKKITKKLSSHKNIALLVNEMRLLKSSSEISLIKKAISITKQAHHRAMQWNKTGKKEYELQAEIEYVFKKNGAYSDAYTSIVACGNSANTLHYIDNDKALVKDELILIDAGCEYAYYASDITRTIPVSGKFSQAQKELYNMVLEVQLKIIKMIQPGVKKSKIQRKSEKLLCNGMIQLGILKGECKKLIKDKEHKKYYPHGIGHWMGLDVHDEAPYRDKNNKEIALKKGMVLTIEPGIYCDKNDKTIPKKYRGIGIRIEDNILVTKKGCENLSLKIAKSVQEIESFSK
ncbi:aminopeptidase P N-terminal domain-containing protein [bacterium]|nr:aminopeptidase P N-terminal domain-containing protein [bacterium]MBU1994695.1 aminopeptidase P N-terminal domain-containing protein [bacterium]